MKVLSNELESPLNIHRCVALALMCLGPMTYHPHTFLCWFLNHPLLDTFHAQATATAPCGA